MNNNPQVNSVKKSHPTYPQIYLLWLIKETMQGDSLLDMQVSHILSILNHVSFRTASYKPSSFITLQISPKCSSENAVRDCSQDHVE